MKKFLTLALTAVMALSLLTACGSKNDNSADTNTDGSNNETTLSGTVSTDGSTSMEKVINSLGESFMAMNKDVKFTYNPTGSGSGIQAVSEGRCDIGLSSRALKDDEKASGLVETVVALDGIAIVVNPENPVSDLDIDTIAKIYTGEITNWKDVGGNDAEIVLIGREAGSGTRDGFESITGTKDACKYQNELTSTGEVIAAVASNPNAIGYASLSAVDETVKAITVGGVDVAGVDPETLLTDYTEVFQDVVLFNGTVMENIRLGRREATDEEVLAAAAQAFVDFATSADASDLIASAGAVPVAE